MIVDAALRDMRERKVHRLERVRPAVAEPRAPQQLEELRLREFGRAPDSAIDRIDCLDQTRREAFEHRLVWCPAAGAAAARIEALFQHVRVMPDLVALIAID